MKSYLPATVLGIALTAGAFGFGAATAHASDYTRHDASQVSTVLQTTGYALNGAMSWQ